MNVTMKNGEQAHVQYEDGCYLLLRNSDDFVIGEIWGSGEKRSPFVAYKYPRQSARRATFSAVLPRFMTMANAVKYLCK